MQILAIQRERMQSRHQLKAATHPRAIIEASNSDNANRKMIKTVKNKKRKRRDVAEC